MSSAKGAPREQGNVMSQRFIAILFSLSYTYILGGTGYLFLHVNQNYII
jgi:hypothetical protein